MKRAHPSGGGEYRIVTHPLLDVPVLVSPGRMSRPKDRGRSKKCPFCPGNEALTPPTLYSVPEDKDWQIRVFSNLYPLVSSKSGSQSYGIHEIIVETPEHDALFHALPVGSISQVLKVIRDRMNFHSSNENLKALVAFRNEGLRGGASLVHPHTQLVGLAHTPPRLNYEGEGFISMAEKGRCPLCLEPSDPTIILEESSFRAFSPVAPRLPRETWIAPVQHEPSFMNLKECEIDDMAALLKKMLTAIAALQSPNERSFDYNLVLHTEPLDDESGTFHTHLEILPRPEALAGFELGTGLMVNPVEPGQAVSEIREMLIT